MKKLEEKNTDHQLDSLAESDKQFGRIFGQFNFQNPSRGFESKDWKRIMEKLNEVGIDTVGHPTHVGLPGSLCGMTAFTEAYAFSFQTILDRQPRAEHAYRLDIKPIVKLNIPELILTINGKQYKMSIYDEILLVTQEEELIFRGIVEESKGSEGLKVLVEEEVHQASIEPAPQESTTEPTDQVASKISQSAKEIVDK